MTVLELTKVWTDVTLKLVRARLDLLRHCDKPDSYYAENESLIATELEEVAELERNYETLKRGLQALDRRP